MAGGPLGALAGIVLGGLFDTMLDAVNTPETQGTFDGQSGYATQQRQQYEGQRNSFLFSLLVLAAYIIRADGRVMHSEMELVRQMLRQNFGDAAVTQGDTVLRRLFDEQKRVGAQSFQQTVASSCAQIALNMDHSQRLQLLAFLAEIAKADGRVDASEVAALKQVAAWMRLSPSEVDSLLSLGGQSLDDAYRVLGVSPQATDDEVKRAYKRLALQHHPDRVAALGEDVRRAAEKKLQEINEAKERIYKARGL